MDKVEYRNYSVKLRSVFDFSFWLRQELSKCKSSFVRSFVCPVKSVLKLIILIFWAQIILR